MKNKTRLLSSAAIAAFALLLFLPGPARSGDPIYLNFGTVAPEGTPWADQLVTIKKRIEAKSEGRIVVRLFMGGTLGGEVQMVRDIVDGGRLQGGGFSTAAVAEGANVPELQLPELPFLFRSDAEADHILDTVLREPIKKKLKRRGLFLNMWAINGWRSFYSSKGPIKSLEDLRANKMRRQESKVHKLMYEALGVQAVAIGTPEVLDALNRGTVDGFDNTTLFGQASGWFEPTPHYTLSKHIFQPAAIVYSQDFIDGLPEDLREIVIGDWQEEQRIGRKGVRDLEGELLATFKELGVTVYEPTTDEMAPFRAATAGIAEEMREEVGSDLLTAVKDALKAYRQ